MASVQSVPEEVQTEIVVVASHPLGVPEGAAL